MVIVQDIMQKNCAVSCIKCKRKIEVGAVIDKYFDRLTCREKLGCFHVECYVPRLSLPVFVNNDFSADLKTKLKNWNAQFDLPDFKDLTKVLLNFEINFKPARSWIEILKFLEPKELIRLGEVNKTMFMYSRMSEIWAAITNLQGLSGRDIINKYIFINFSICVICKSNENLMFCIVLRRPFCWKCYKNVHKFKGNGFKLDLRPVSSLMKLYKVNWDFFDRVRICYDARYVARTYPILVEEALNKYGRSFNSEKRTRKRQKIREE